MEAPSLLLDLMFDDSISFQEKLDLATSPPLYPPPSLPSLFSGFVLPPNIYNNFTLQDIEKSFLSKEYENFHNIWRLDGLVPERGKRFYNEFPRVGSNWDNEHHSYSDYSFILLWFPAFGHGLGAAGWLFPELYERKRPLQYLAKPSLEETPKANLESNLKHNKSKSKLFNANPVPTSFERGLCDDLNGKGLYNRKGRWSCYLVVGEIVDLEYDEFGSKFFASYEDFLAWKRGMNEILRKRVESGDLEGADLVRNVSYSDD